MPTLQHDGYELHRAVFGEDELARLRDEAEALARETGSVCIRHLRSHSASIDALSRDPRLLALIPAGQLAVRSILFDKNERQNWPVAWHQDLTIAVDHRDEVAGYGPWSVKDGVPHVQAPDSLLHEMATLRIHLDDSPADNGALRVAPGSHRLGKIPADEIGAHVEGPQSVVTCSCAAGDVLLMSPLLLHSSPRAIHPDRRRVIHFEYAPCEQLSPRLRWRESASAFAIGD